MDAVLKGTASLLALGVVAGLAGGAKAADVAEAPVGYSWSGFHIGAYAGAGALVTRFEFDVPPLIESAIDGTGDDGILAGALLGYNWQVSDRFVVGVQGDIAFPDMEVFDVLTLSEFGPDFVASASLRAGYLVTPDTLLYVIGGYSYGEFDNASDPAAVFLESDNDAFDGFHVGAGMETRITDRLTARIEYRYTGFGGEQIGDDLGGVVDFELTPHMHTGTIGLAYNLFPTLGEGIQATPAAATVEPVADWTGFYLGVKGGAGAFVSDSTIADVDIDTGGEGFLGSIMAGLNWQIGDSVVLGLQGDIGLADMKWDFDSATLLTPEEKYEATLNWFASASLRAGWLLSPKTMIYAIGGYSFAEFELDSSVVSAVAATFRNSDKEGFDGFHVGAGIEARLTDNLTARAEYRYTDYGEGGFVRLAEFDTTQKTIFDFATHTGTIGIAWLFDAM